MSMQSAHFWGMSRQPKKVTPFGKWARDSKLKNSTLAVQLGCSVNYVSRLRCGREEPSDLMKAKIIVLTKGAVSLDSWLA